MEHPREIVVSTSLLASLDEDGFGSDVTGLIFDAPVEDNDQICWLTQALEKSRYLTTISLRADGSKICALKVLSSYLSAPSCQVTTLIIAGNMAPTFSVDPFDQKDGELMAVVLRSNKSITTLKLEVERASDEIIGVISSYLRTSTTLHSLSMKGTPLTLNQATDLADGLANNTSLQELNLSACHLEDRECSLIAGALQTHKTLRVLDLSYNSFTASGLARSYMVHCEHFDGRGHEEIKSLLLVNDVLEELNLVGCNTDREDIRHICEGLVRHGLRRNRSLVALQLEQTDYCDEDDLQLIETCVRRNMMSRSQYWAAVVLQNILRSKTLILLLEIWIQILSYAFPAIDNFQDFALEIHRNHRNKTQF